MTRTFVKLNHTLVSPKPHLFTISHIISPAETHSVQTLTPCKLKTANSSLTLGKLDVVDVTVECKRHGCAERQEPDGGYDAHGPPKSGHGVGEQRVTDGQIPLQTERDDYQYGDVRCPGTIK